MSKVSRLLLLLLLVAAASLTGWRLATSGLPFRESSPRSVPVPSVLTSPPDLISPQFYPDAWPQRVEVLQLGREISARLTAPPAAASSPNSAASVGETAALKKSTSQEAPNPGQQLSTRTQDQVQPASEDITVINELLNVYLRSTGAMPVGEDNVQITGRLTGHNPRGVAVIPPDHPAINAQGELTDRWGTPYFFHAESATRMPVRSAGPDKRMWSPDDIITADWQDIVADGR